MEKWCLQASMFIFYQLFVKLAKNLGQVQIMAGLDQSLRSHMPMSTEKNPYIPTLLKVNISKTSWSVLVKFNV